MKNTLVDVVIRNCNKFSYIYFHVYFRKRKNSESARMRVPTFPIEVSECHGPFSGRSRSLRMKIERSVFVWSTNALVFRAEHEGSVFRAEHEGSVFRAEHESCFRVEHEG